jgi:hypothetical protein
MKMLEEISSSETSVLTRATLRYIPEDGMLHEEGLFSPTEIITGNYLVHLQVLSAFVFTLLVYFISGQPSDMGRFNMFFVISLLIVYVAMSFGLMIGAVFNVVVSPSYEINLYLNAKPKGHVGEDIPRIPNLDSVP